MPKTELLPELKGEKHIDNQLVIDAKIRIKSILTEHLGAAAYEVVDYLLETFFNSNKENLKAVRLNAHKSFQELLKEIQGETGKSKSWVYEAIKLWKDREILGDFEPYMQLSISHRALLLKVTNVEDKKKYAQEFVEKQLSYKKAKEEVRTESPATKYTLLSRLINHPTDFDDDEFKEKTAKVTLKKTYTELKEAQQFEIVRKAKKRVENLEQTIAAQKELLEKAKLVQNKLDVISAAVSSDSEK